MPTPSSQCSHFVKALTLLSAFAITGCSQPDDNKHIGGKGDSLFDCDDDEEGYLSWLTSYKRSAEFQNALQGQLDRGALQQLATDKPCAFSDRAYKTWFAAFDQLWNDATDTQINRNGEAGDKEIDSQDEAKLDAMLIAKPEGSGAAGFTIWVETFPQHLRAATTVIMDQSLTMIIEEFNVITETESEMLSLYIEASPRSEARGAYAAWIQMYAPLIDDAFNKEPNSEGLQTFSDGERKYLNLATAFVPGAVDEVEYLIWWREFETRFDRVTGSTNPELTDNELAMLKRFADVRPTVGGERSAKAWLSQFSEVVSAMINAPDLAEARVASAELLVAVRPCGTFDGLDEKWAKIVNVTPRLPSAVSTAIAESSALPCD